MNFKTTTTAILALAVIGSLYPSLHAQDTRSVWDGVYTKEQANQGQGRYNASCAGCHGNTLEGGEMAPPLAGGAFLSNWDGLTLGDLLDRIRTTMPANAPGSLSREANTQILAYILSFNQFPAGEKDLPQQSEFLKQIKIEASKPQGKK